MCPSVYLRPWQPSRAAIVGPACRGHTYTTLCPVPRPTTALPLSPAALPRPARHCHGLVRRRFLSATLISPLTPAPPLRLEPRIHPSTAGPLECPERSPDGRPQPDNASGGLILILGLGSLVPFSSTLTPRFPDPPERPRHGQDGAPAEHVQSRVSRTGLPPSPPTPHKT